MPATLPTDLVVAISSRALFDFEEENRVFSAANDKQYMALQYERLNVPAKRGVAFPLIEKLLAFNSSSTQRVEVVILSRNDPVSGLRVFRSAQQENLPVQRGVFTRGRSPFRYLNPLKANLFLSANEEDVQSALLAGFPAARVYPHSAVGAEKHPNEVRIAFDGDAVLFSDEAEKVFQLGGLRAFQEHEFGKASTPLPAGPLKPFLAALHRLQSVTDPGVNMKIRTVLVTARSSPAHERAIRTLMDWEIEVDEAMFLGGLEKGSFLKEFEPDFFFDDQLANCESGATVGPTAQVISGVRNNLVLP